MAPIPRLDLGFGCRYRNQVSVVHYHTVNTMYFLITITVTKPQQVLVMLWKPRKKLSHNLIVNFAVMLDSMNWNATMTKEKQICLWINDLTKTIGSKISNMSIMPEKGQKRAKLMPKDTRGMSKSILFLDKMLPKVFHPKLQVPYWREMPTDSTICSFQVIWRGYETK